MKQWNWSRFWWGFRQPLWLGALVLASWALFMAPGCAIFDPGGQVRAQLKQITEHKWSDGEYVSFIGGTHEGSQFMLEADPEKSKVVFIRLDDGSLVPVSAEGFSAMLYTNSDNSGAVTAGETAYSNARQMFSDATQTVNKALGVAEAVLARPADAAPDDAVNEAQPVVTPLTDDD